MMNRFTAAFMIGPLCLLSACPPVAEEECNAGGDLSLAIGSGVADEFTAYAEGDAVALSVAPQGGFGVSVRVRTEGLVADAPVSVLMETHQGGALAGSFLNESVQLFCQDDGAGLLWGIVVGFDPEVYSTNDDLLRLDQELITLKIAATDEDGAEAVGEVEVLIVVGG